MDDCKIIELYFARDEKAIEETAAKYGDYCLAIALNVLSVHADAEEYVNDTYLRTWQSIPPLRPNSLKLFLARVTRNFAIDRYRAARSDKRGSGEITVALHEIDEFLPADTDLDDEMRHRALLESVQKFLYAQPERERNIFLLRYFHTRSAKEIAAQYKMRKGTVLRILSRARNKLKEHLEKEGYSI